MGVADVDAEDIIDAAAVDRFALHVDLPGAAEQVEVVDVGAAEHRLQRIEDGGNVDAQRLHLLPVDIEIELRRIRRVSGEDAR